VTPAIGGDLTLDDALSWLPNQWERLNRHPLSSAVTRWTLSVAWAVLTPKLAYKARFVERLRGRRIAIYVVVIAALGIATRAFYELTAARSAEADIQNRRR
jgi:hypothetical protein